MTFLEPTKQLTLVMSNNESENDADPINSQNCISYINSSFSTQGRTNPIDFNITFAKLRETMYDPFYHDSTHTDNLYIIDIAFSITVYGTSEG